MRLTVRFSSEPWSVSARWAAGSEVVRCTGSPRRASSTATAAAKVVLPTPPLPISITRPRPSAAMPSTSSDRLGARSSTGAPSSHVEARRRFGEQLAQGVEPHKIEWLERDIDRSGRRLKNFGHRGQSRLLALANGGGERIERRFFVRQEAVDDEILLSRPTAASSAWVRAASRKADCWARATRIRRVRRSSARASTAA